jgi:hypothetical protein
VIQQSLVDQLEGNLDRLEAVNDDVEQRNSELDDLVGRLRETESALAEQGPVQLLQGRLPDTTVVMMGVDGINEGSLDALRDALATAGATVIGPIWLRERLALPEGDGIEDLAAILGVEPTSPPVVQAELVQQLGGLLAVVSASRPVPTEGEGSGRAAVSTRTAVGNGIRLLDLLEDLEQARFVDVDGGLDELRGSTFVGTRLVVAGGQGATIDHRAVVLPILEQLGRNGRPVAVAVEAPLVDVDAPPEPEEGGVTPGEFVGAIRSDRRLREQVSTVDDAGMFVGWAATVLALGDLGEGRVGHYGTGDGAERLLPAPAPS